MHIALIGLINMFNINFTNVTQLFARLTLIQFLLEIVLQCISQRSYELFEYTVSLRPSFLSHDFCSVRMSYQSTLCHLGHYFCYMFTQATIFSHICTQQHSYVLLTYYFSGRPQFSVFSQPKHQIKPPSPQHTPGIPYILMYSRN